jgi:hypothetical protein
MMRNTPSTIPLPSPVTASHHAAGIVRLMSSKTAMRPRPPMP